MALDKIVNDIRTFADCDYRIEEILNNREFANAGIIGIVTDPGLLDWSGCTYIPGETCACQTLLEGGKCPMKFPY